MSLDRPGLNTVISNKSIELSLSSVEIHEKLEELYEFQQILLDKEMSCQKNIEFINNFVNKFPRLALHQLEISMHIRPQLFKQYAEVIEQFPTLILDIIPEICQIPDLIFNILYEKGKIPNYHSTSAGFFSKSFQGTPTNRNILTLKETGAFPDANISEALSDDNADFFVESSANNKIDFNAKISVYGSSDKLLPIEAAALYGATKCFKYLLLNNSNIDECTAQAVAGGSFEIIRILEQNGKTFSNCDIYALIYRQDDIFDWLTKGTFKGTNFSYFINTFSIKAIIGLTKTGIFRFNETAAFIFMAEKNLLTEEMIKSMEPSKNCFLATHDEKLLNLFINKNNIKSLLLTACEKRSVFHIKAIINNNNFDIGSADQSSISIAKETSQEIRDLIYSKSQSNGIALYNQARKKSSFIGKRSYDFSAINSANVYSVVYFALSKGDFSFVSDMSEKTELLNTLTEEELIELAQYQSPEIIMRILEVNHSTEYLVGAFEIMNNDCINKISASVQNSSSVLTTFLSNKEFCDMVSPKEVIKLIMMNPDKIVVSALSAFLIQKNYITEATKISNKDSLEQAVFTSEVFTKEIDVKFALTQYKVYEPFIMYFTTIEMEEDDFNSFISLTQSRQVMHINQLKQILSKPAHRKFFEKIASCKELINCIADFDFTEEEAQIIIRKRMTDIFFKKQSNKKYLSAMELIKNDNDCDLVNDLKGKELTEEELNSLAAKICINIDMNDVKQVDSTPSIHYLLGIKGVAKKLPSEIVFKYILNNGKPDDVTYSICSEYLTEKHPFEVQYIFCSIVKDFESLQEKIKESIDAFRENFHPFLVSFVIDEKPQLPINEDGTLTITSSQELKCYLKHSDIMKVIAADKIVANEEALQVSIRKCVKENDLEALKYLLSTNIDMKGGFGANLMKFAIIENNEQAALLIMEQGVPAKLLKKSVSNMKKCSLKEKLIPLIPDYEEPEKSKPVTRNIMHNLGLLGISKGNDIVESEIHQYDTAQLIKALNDTNVTTKKSIAIELLNRDLTMKEYSDIPPIIFFDFNKESTEIVKEQDDIKKVLFTVCSGINMLPDSFVIPKGALAIAASRCDKEIWEKMFSQNPSEEEIENSLYQALTNSQNKYEFVQTCLSFGFDPNHLFERNNDVESFLNLCIMAGKQFFDIIMEYKPITARVTQKSPLEVAFEYNVPFINDVLPLADEEYSKDRELIKRIKYINKSPTSFPVIERQKVYIEKALLMKKALSLANHKVLVCVPNYICDSLVCNDPDEFEKRQTGFFNAFEMKKYEHFSDPKIKNYYHFSNVDTIIVKENCPNINQLASCLTVAPEKRQILVVGDDPNIIQVNSRSFDGIISGTTEKGTFSEAITGTVSGEDIPDRPNIAFRRFLRSSEQAPIVGNINGFAISLGSFRLKVKLIPGSDEQLKGTITGTSNVSGAITGRISIRFENSNDVNAHIRRMVNAGGGRGIAQLNHFNAGQQRLIGNARFNPQQQTQINTAEFAGAIMRSQNKASSTLTVSGTFTAQSMIH